MYRGESGVNRLIHIYLMEGPDQGRLNEEPKTHQKVVLLGKGEGIRGRLYDYVKFPVQEKFDCLGRFQNCSPGGLECGMSAFP